MDRMIAKFHAERDKDLTLCISRGVAYQSDMGIARVQYDADYFAKVLAYEGTEIAKKVNEARVALVARHAAKSAWLIDVGAGSGAFVRAAKEAGFSANGYDVMGLSAALLKQEGLWANDVSGFEAVTAWDVIEHMEEPELFIRQVRKGALLFLSTPLFGDLQKIRDSKHYRPGEHLFYFTSLGLVDWIARYGYRLLEYSNHETKAGRESIGAFAFKRDLDVCECGGKLFVDAYHPIVRPSEYFKRCSECTSFGKIFATEQEALAA